MSDISNADIMQKLTTLESKMNQFNENSDKKEVKEVKEIKEVKQKKARKQSEYNMFMGKYLKEQKKELGELYDHKKAFGEGAKKWNESKVNK